MVHPMKKEGVAGHNDKLRRMTRHYGDANPSMKKNAPVDRAKTEGPEDAVEYGADYAASSARSDRPGRRSTAANPVATYKKGGAVKRASGGRVHKGKTNININVIPQGSMGQSGVSAQPPVIPLGGNPAVPPPMPPAPPQAGGIPPQLAAALAGAGGAKPPGMMPMRKRGGRVHSDEAEDEALVHKMVKSSALKRAKGGKIHLTAGSDSGPGRLEKTAARARNARHERPQAV